MESTLSSSQESDAFSPLFHLYTLLKLNVQRLKFHANTTIKNPSACHLVVMPSHTVLYMKLYCILEHGVQHLPAPLLLQYNKT